MVLNYIGVRSADGVEFDNSYDRGQPLSVLLGAGKVIQGWEQGLVGVQAGMRRQMDIPADLAYGKSGSGTVIRPGDALSFVVDVLAVLPSTTADEQPAITVHIRVGAGTAQDPPDRPAPPRCCPGRDTL